MDNHKQFWLSKEGTNRQPDGETFEQILAILILEKSYMSKLQTWEQSSFKVNIERSTYIFLNSVVKELSSLTDESERQISDSIVDCLVKDLKASWNESKKSELMTKLGYNN